MGQRLLERHEATLRRCTLAYLDRPCAVDAFCEKPLRDSFRLLLPHGERIESRINAKPAATTPAMAVLHAPGQDLHLAIDPFRLLLLGIDGDFARQALARHFVDMPPFDMWATAFPLDTPAATTLCSFCHWLAQELERPGCLLRNNERLVDCMERTLLAFFVELLADRHPSLHASSEELAERQLMHIEAWIEENLGEPIGVEDLAAVADVSARSVQITFRRFRGCTPMQFVLNRRLERARELLQAPEPQTTVTAVASECGVFQFGRFAVQYRERFGEKPSETLTHSRAMLGLKTRPGSAGLRAAEPVQIAKYCRSVAE